MKDKFQFRENIARRLIELRHEHNYTSGELCNRLSISCKMYQAYEERRAEPSTRMLILLAEFYGITIGKLLTFETCFKNTA